MTENIAYYPRRGYAETHRGGPDGYRRVFFRKQLGGQGVSRSGPRITWPRPGPPPAGPALMITTVYSGFLPGERS